MLRVRDWSLTYWVKHGKFPAPIRPGGGQGRRLYLRSEVEKFLADLRRARGASRED
jgi:hypothetical protein